MVSVGLLLIQAINSLTEEAGVSLEAIKTLGLDAMAMMGVKSRTAS